MYYTSTANHIDDVFTPKPRFPLVVSPPPPPHPLKLLEVEGVLEADKELLLGVSS